MRLADAGSSGPGPVAQGPGFLRGRRPADPIMLCRSSAGPCLSAGRKLPAPPPAPLLTLHTGRRGLSPRGTGDRRWPGTRSAVLRHC